MASVELQTKIPDTGWRNIASLLWAGGWDPSSTLRIRREGSLVFVEGFLKASATPTPQIVSVPSGFKQAANYVTFWSNRTHEINNHKSGPVFAVSDTLLAGAELQFTFIYRTDASFPTVLPGVAV